MTRLALVLLLGIHYRTEHVQGETVINFRMRDSVDVRAFATRDGALVVWSAWDSSGFVAWTR